MSRLGKTPIKVPKGVEVKRDATKVQVKGPKGSIAVDVPEEIEVIFAEGEVRVSLPEGSKLPHAMHGLYRGLIRNAVVGTSEGFKKELTLIGVGFRAAVKGRTLDLQLGFSHPCEVAIPEGITVEVEKSTMVTVSGIDCQAVGQFAANVRALKPPEPYKGKGIRYVDEYVRKKAGKAAKGK